jgi:hypothetical protein
MKILTGIGAVVMFLVILSITLFLPAWLFMLAWNFVAPVFGGPVLTFWQSFAITFILSRIGGWFKSTSKKD